MFPSTRFVRFQDFLILMFVSTASSASLPACELHGIPQDFLFKVHHGWSSDDGINQGGGEWWHSYEQCGRPTDLGMLGRKEVKVDDDDDDDDDPVRLTGAVFCTSWVEAWNQGYIIFRLYIYIDYARGAFAGIRLHSPSLPHFLQKQSATTMNHGRQLLYRCPCCEIFVKVALAFSVALVLDLDQGICASKWLILILVWNLHPYLGLCGKILAGLLQCVWSFYVMTMVS